MFCLAYSHTKIAAVTCTFSDLTKPCWGISTQLSIIGNRSQGTPSFSCLKIKMGFCKELYRYFNLIIEIRETNVSKQPTSVP